jgi:hypothetical protein
MKSFAFGAAAALIAAYTIADIPERAASVQQASTPSLMYDAATQCMVQKAARRNGRGLPPFWGRAGLSAY